MRNDNVGKQLFVSIKISMKQNESPYQVEVTKVFSHAELVKDYDVCSHSISSCHYDMKPVAKIIEKNMIVTTDQEGKPQLITLAQIEEQSLIK